jgi:hypothetical protein
VRQVGSLTRMPGVLMIMAGPSATVRVAGEGHLGQVGSLVRLPEVLVITEPGRSPTPSIR